MDDVAQISEQLQMHGSANHAMIRSKNRLINQSKAFVRRQLGWRMDMPEKERDQITKLAARLVEAIEEDDTETLDKLPPETKAKVTFAVGVVLADLAARRPLEDAREKHKKNMEALARQLPVWDWVRGVPGLNENALAKIIAETGDLRNYTNPAKVWKRLGLGLVDCNTVRDSEGNDIHVGLGFMRQGDYTGLGQVAEKNLVIRKHGYDRFRRSIIWSVTDRLIVSQRRKDRTGNFVYAELYVARKEYEAARRPEFRKPDGTFTAHCDLRAKRYVAKRIIRDLWRAWNRDGLGSHDTRSSSVVPGLEEPQAVMST